jgi:PAS domain S-box-containing protein
MSEKASLNNSKLFPPFWVSIVRTRFFLCLVIFIYSFIDPNIKSKKQLWVLIAAYGAFNISLRLLKSETLYLKRIRIIPSLIDIVFISLVIQNATGPGNSWFLFYLFPIISVARYLGYKGTLFLALCSIAAYLFLYIASMPNQDVDPYTFVLRCMVLIGVGAVAANLAKARQKELSKLIKILEEIDGAILSDMKLEQILNLILKKALEFTNSKMGHIRLRDSETQEYKIVTIIGHPKGYDWGTRPLDDGFSQIAIRLKEPLIVPQITKRHLNKYLGTYFNLHHPRPKSALFVPLTLKDNVIGIIALYSYLSRHYTMVDARRLTAFTPLIEMATKTVAARERHQRLRLLNKIGKKLRSGLSLPDLFKEVVELTVHQLDSEEAALFIRSEDGGRLVRVEVSGAAGSVAEKLPFEEMLDSSMDAFTEKVFRTEQPFIKNDILPKEWDVGHYSKSNLSGEVKHYLGVPLIVGEEILGVVRVINKKSANYPTDDKKIAISKKGFDNEDVELLQIIASMVAPELRSAERLKKLTQAQRYYRDLIVNSPDPIIVLDKDGNITVFNRACEELWGVSYEEVRNKPVGHYYESVEHAKEIGRMLWESEDHHVENFEARVRHFRTGEIIPISLSACFVKDEQGEQIGSIGVFKDRRDSIKMEEKVLQAERLAVVGRLARTTGHDIKHNVATALNYIDGLLFKCDKEREPRLHKIYSNIYDALRESIDGLQNLLMANTPKQPQKAVLRVNDFFHKVEEQMRRQAHDRDIRFVVNYLEQECIVSADIEQMASVLSNLFTNSIHAIEERKAANAPFKNGLIEVSARVNKNHVHLLWQDNGCGITENDRQNIFNAFFTNKGNDMGTGLGLYIVKTIIENHDGRIEVESDPGSGTRFQITLPILDAMRRNENFLEQ